MKKKINNINKDVIKRNKFLQIEIEKIISKSIFQNSNVKPQFRALAIKKITKKFNKNSISNQNNNLCLKSGRFKGVLRNTQLTRHEMKKLAITGSLQNFKISSW